MSGLNATRLASLLVVALFVLPLLAPLIAAVPASAQDVPLRVTNFVVTSGGELGFILNRTLIPGHPVHGAPVLFFWACKHGATALIGDEFLLATITVGGGAEVVFGTLLVNETIGGWLGAGSGSIYLKVSSAPYPGVPGIIQAVASSDPFTLLVDTAVIERTLRVLHAPTDRPARDFAFHPFFGRSNRPEFVLNLSAIGIGLGEGKTLVDEDHNILVDIVNFTLIKGRQEEYAVGGRAVTLRSTFLVGLGFGKQAGDALHNVVRLNGTIGDFALRFPTDLTTVNGTTVAYQAFKLIATVKNGSIDISGNWAKVDKGRVTTGTGSVTFNHTVASIGWTRTVNIYPTVTFSFTPSPGVVGGSASIELRNFKPGTYTPSVAFFARLPDFTYVELPVKASPASSITVGPTGTTIPFTVTIPDNPYGGRPILATVNVSAGWALAGPLPIRVNPTITVQGFDNTGDLTSPTFAPGEYLFIVGRGFLVVTPDIDLMNGTVRIPLTVAASTGVFGNGSFGAIVQIPPGIALYTGNSVTLRVYTGDPATTTNIATTPGTVSLGTVRVFIEPRPRIIQILPTASARVDLGATRFPSPATWEPEAARKFTLLVYGAPHTALRFNVSLFSPTITVDLNVSRTGVGSLNATFNVPEAPFVTGGYRVRVNSSGVGTWDSDSAVQKRLNISATAAAFDPARGRFDKRVFLDVAVNLTVRGFGFKANEAVKYDIRALGLTDVSLLSGPASDAISVVASPRGSFTGWIHLPSIIRAPGTYAIRIHQNPGAEIIITIGVPPPFTVRVVTGATKFADLPLDIWVLAFYGGSFARQDQITSVSLAVYLRVGVGDRIIIENLNPVVVVPGQAIFHAKFTAPEEALGRDLLVVATVKARFSPI
ncbi:MAG: hypothetical protein ACO2O2_05575, partial [Acidilobaceae archaeon]